MKRLAIAFLVGFVVHDVIDFSVETWVKRQEIKIRKMAVGG